MLRMGRRALAAVALATGLVLVLQGAAMAATVNVSIFNFGYNPASAKAKQNDTIHWVNDSNASHTVTNTGCVGSPSAGAALFCSGNIPAAGSDTFDFVLTTASKYVYTCKIHPSMEGSVAVAVKANPASGSELTVFTITWASGVGVPAGYQVDVQIKRPGDAGFSNWMVNQTGKSATFTADDGPGTYSFRARLEKTADPNARASFSAAKKITVT